MRLLKIIVAFFVLLGATAPAQAVVISRIYEFAGSGFSPAGAPVDPVIGSVAVTFDNAADILAETSGIALIGLNIALDGPIGFRYTAAIDFLQIGVPVVGVVAVGDNDFILGIFDASTVPTFGGLFYAQGGASDIYSATSGSVRARAIPEPGALALFGLGLAGLAALRRRQGRRVGD